MSKTRRYEMQGLAIGAALATLLALGPRAGGAAGALAWDQERVRVLVAELDGLVGTIQVTIEAVQSLATDMERREGYAALEDLRALKNTTAHLASMLGAGMEREPTLPVFESVRGLRAGVQRNARPEWFGTAAMGSIISARQILQELEQYY